MTAHRLMLAAALCAVLAGCGSDEPAEDPAVNREMGSGVKPVADSAAPADNGRPVIERLYVSPSEPRPGEHISALVQASDPDGDPIELVYDWRIDGRRTGHNGSSMPVEAESKNALIEVIVVARDGVNESEPARASARIGNRPPQILQVVIEPMTDVTVGNDITASPRATDPDGDPVSYSYRWQVNDREIGQNEAVLRAVHYSRGDRIRLSVTASDGQQESEALQSQEIVVGNAAPVITSVPAGFEEDGTFRYKVEAEDPDGDSLFRYRLVEGPKGMKLDVVSGELAWKPDESQAGTHRVSLEVDDRSGGVATQLFDVQVAFETVSAEKEGEDVPAAPAN